MRNVLAFLVGVLLALVVGVATAAESCTQIRIRYSSGGTDNVAPDSKIHEESNWKFSHAEACSSLATRMAGLNIGGINIGTTTLTAVMSSGAYRCEGSAPRPGLSDQVFSAGHFSGETRSAECPPGPCDDKEGQPLFGTGTSSGGCIGGCALQMQLPTTVIRASGASSTSGVAHWRYSGEECAAEPAVTAGNCLFEGGNRMCAQLSGDDVKVSVGADSFIPKDVVGCESFSSGGVVCVVDGPTATENVPDDGGSPAAPAAPTAIANSEDKEVNYYSSTTVANSSTTIITGSGGASAAQGGVVGDGGDGEGGSLDDLEGGNMDSADGFGDSTGGFWDRVAGSALVSAVSGISGSLTGGSCPAWSDTVEAGAFGTYELDFSFICGMWEDIAPVISAVMLAVFALAALRILMSA